jgi:hypothetical protein
MCFQLQLAIFPIDVNYTFVFTNGTAGLDYTTTTVTVTVRAGNCKFNTQLPIRLMKITKTLPLLLELATGTINDNDNAPTVNHRSGFG